MKKEFDKSILRIRSKILDRVEDIYLEFIKENNLIYLPIPNDAPVSEDEFDIENLEKNAEKFGIKEFVVMGKHLDIDSEYVKESEKIGNGEELCAQIIETKNLNTQFWPVLSDNFNDVIFFDLDFKFIGVTHCDDYRVYASSRELLECVTGRKIEETIELFKEFFTPNHPLNVKRFKETTDSNLKKHYESLENYK